MKMLIEQWTDPKLLRILVQGSLVRLWNRIEILNAMARTCTTAKQVEDSTRHMIRQLGCSKNPRSSSTPLRSSYADLWVS